MRSSASLLAPILTPTGRAKGRVFCKRCEAAAWPRLLKPKRLMSAPCCGKRNTRGLGLPGCGRGVKRAYLGKTETDAMDTGNGCAVFVKTRRHAERISEIKPHNMLRQNRFILRRHTEAAQQD